jgi:6-phosphogluconolactonase
LACLAARFIAARISSAPERFSLCLSGGSTPKRAYELLGAKDLGASLDWQKVHLFWGDERLCRQIIETAISAWPARP